MNLVMLYSFGDGCTWSCDRVYTLVAESVEAAFVSFDDAYKKAKASNSDFEFCNETFCTCDFEDVGNYYPPTFCTVEAWFLSNGVTYEDATSKLEDRIDYLEWENKGIAEWRDLALKALLELKLHNVPMTSDLQVWADTIKTA